MDQVSLSANSHIILLSMLSLILSGTVVILGLWCIWRVEKRLDTFMKLLTLAVFLGGVRKALGIFGFDQSSSWKQILLYFELVNTFLILLAFIEIARIIHFLSNGKKK